MQEAEMRDLLEAVVRVGRHEFGYFLLSRLFGMAVSYEADACVVNSRASNDKRVRRSRPVHISLF